MLNLIHPLVGASSFIPHGHCYLWKPTLVWLHLTSDLLIALAYYSIPILLIDFARKRKDLPFPWLFWLFGAFIVCCGTTHLLAVWTLWHPVYWVSGGLKAITALVSVITAAALFLMVPQALALPSPAQIAALNQSLQAEIVERQQIEADLRSREASLKEAQSLAHLGNWEFDLATQKITWSEELFRIFGLDPTQPEPGYNEHLQMFEPESRQQLDAVVQQTVVTGEPYELELQFCRADGFLRWIVARGKAVQNSQGAVVRLFGTALDITERKLAEQEAQESKRTLDALMEYIPEGITIADAPDVTIRRVSRYGEALVGRSRTMLENIPVDQHVQTWGIVCADGVTPAKDEALPLTRAIKEGEVIADEEWVLHHVDGSRIDISCTAGPIRDQDGKVTGGVIAWRDITERKRAEAEAKAAIQIKATLQEKEASLREKEVLLQEIHHRVKNNLQIIDGLLQMQSRRTDNPQAAAILLESQHRVKSIALVHEKLYQSEDLAKINFSDYLRSLVSTLFDSYSTASNRITKTIQVDNIELNIDTAIPCGLIVNELISNALKYAFPGDRDGEVRLDFHAQESNQWVLSVKDTGVGIPEHINLQKTRSLGLKLVRGFAEQLEGSVEINRSKGTLISITFPQQ